jgi:RNA methyltransferase, TrmH family
MPPPGRPPRSAHPRANRPGPPSARAAASPPRDADEPRKLFRVAGLSAVSALFAHDPARVERLFFDERLKPAVGAFCKTMAAARKPYRMVEGEELAKVAGTVLHGGVVALMAPRAVPAFDGDAARRWSEPLLILDGVGNPHNLGAILRTAAFFGLPRVLLSDHPGQALPSEAAYRVGTALDPKRPTIDVSGLSASDRDRRPLAVVLGNEEDGAPPATLAACEALLTIPGGGRVQSLNVAATAAILIHALAVTPR